MRRAIAAFGFAAALVLAMTGVAQARIVSPYGVTMSGGYFGPSLSGSRVAYVDWADGACTIRVTDLSDGSDRALGHSAGRRWHPSLEGGRVVWEDYRGGARPHIYLYDIASGVEEKLTSGPSGYYGPSLSGDRVVYQYQLGVVPSEIAVLDLKSGDETRLTIDSEEQRSPCISGDLVVWEDWRTGNADLYLHDLASGTTTRLTSGPGDECDPAIYGDQVVYTEWTRVEPRLASLVGLDIRSHRVERLTDGSITEDAPSLAGDTVAWEAYDAALPEIRVGTAVLPGLSGRGEALHGEAVRLKEESAPLVRTVPVAASLYQAQVLPAEPLHNEARALLPLLVFAGFWAALFGTSHALS